MNTRRWTRVAAYGLIRRDNALLLCRLSARVRQHAGRWTLPGGGVDFGEAPVDALVREVHEETGLHVRAGEVATVDSIVETRTDNQMHGIRILYWAEVVGGTLRSELDESTDLCQWWPQDQLAQVPLVDLASLGVKLAFS